MASLDGAFEDLHAGNCASPNKCSYCAAKAAVENAKMLELDVARGPGPEVWSVLTTRQPTLDMAGFYRARGQTLKALRRRWPTEYACILEYTTGYGPRSEGKRRPHWNLLLKGIPREELDTAAEIIRRLWCKRTDSEPQAQYVGLIEEVGGLSRYLALHFHKESQKPPSGFRGLRFITSRGYFNGELTREQAREEARDALLVDALRRIAREKGLTGAAIEAWISEHLQERAELDWSLIQLGEDRWGEPTLQVLGGTPLDIDRDSA